MANVVPILRKFRLLDATQRHVMSIGIPTDDDPSDRPVTPGWQMLPSKFFDQRNWHAPPATYGYDFGDDWQHVLVHEDFASAEDDTNYPRCVAGEGRCPPEDCGGVHGYAEFLQVIADPEHKEHESTLQWVGASFGRSGRPSIRQAPAPFSHHALCAPRARPQRCH